MLSLCPEITFVENGKSKAQNILLSCTVVKSVLCTQEKNGKLNVHFQQNSSILITAKQLKQ